jgi:hypothetical protein
MERPSVLLYSVICVSSFASYAYMTAVSSCIRQQQSAGLLHNFN